MEKLPPSPLPAAATACTSSSSFTSIPHPALGPQALPWHQEKKDFPAALSQDLFLSETCSWCSQHLDKTAKALGLPGVHQQGLSGFLKNICKGVILEGLGMPISARPGGVPRLCAEFWEH